MAMRAHVGALVFGVAVATARTAAPETPPVPTPVVPAANAATHGGFYLSFRTGLGQLWVIFGDYSVSGRTIPFELSAGVVTAENLILFGEVYSSTASAITSNYQGASTLELFGVGPGLKRYFMPMNVFLSGSVLWSRIRFGNGPTSGGSGSFVQPWGVTGRLSVGREWWLARALGLGVAGELLVGRMENTSAAGPSGKYQPLGFSFLFSGSFN